MIDFYISKVSYDDQHISEVLVHDVFDDGSFDQNGQSCLRDEVVSSIKGGRIYFTIFKEDDEWQIGNRVEIISVNGEEYLRTDPNEAEEDNLVDLPEF